MNTKVLLLALASAASAACYIASGDSPSDPNGTNAPTPSEPPPGTCTNDPWAMCQAMLAAKCQSCHGAKPSGGAPMALVTRADLMAPSKSNPSLNNAQVSLQRMKAGTMPPGGAAAGDVQLLDSWISAGYPAGDPNACADGGLYDGAPVQNPYDTPVQCSSGKMVAHTTLESSSMDPGEDCMSCHKIGGNNPKQFILAGTVYKTAHEPNDCNGSGPYTVSGVDKNGKSWSVKSNAVGNFYVYAGTLTAPLSKITVTDSANKTRAMSADAPVGACNACHTEKGAAPFAPSFATPAPGRVMAP